MKYWKTWRLKEDGGEQRTHLEGPGESYTLCGLDTAGDELVYGKPPEKLPPGKHRITCEHCLQVIEFVKAHLASNK